MRNKLRRLRGLTWLALTAGLAAAMLAVYIWQPRPLVLADDKIYDLWLHFQKPSPISTAPVIIDIDEDSLAEYGQWPWSRFLLAELLARLDEAGIAAVGLDILFIEPDRTSPAHIVGDLEKYRGLSPNLTGLPPEMWDYDRLLAAQLSRSPVVLGLYAYFDGRPGPPPPAESWPALGYVARSSAEARPPEETLTPSSGASRPLAVLSAAAPSGLLNMNPGKDGVVRAVQMAALVDGRLEIGLALRALMVALGEETVFLTSGPYGLESLRVGEFEIPVNPDGSFDVFYKGGRRKFDYISAGDVLAGRTAPELLEGRLALVGTSAPGLMDVRVTPFERVYAGVEVHADVLDAVITGHYIIRPPWTPAAQAGLVILAGLAAGASFGLARPRLYLAVGVLLPLLILAGSLYLLRHQGLFLSPLYSLATVLILGAALLFLRFRQEERKKNILRQSFARYVAPEVVERIARLEGDIFAGEELDVTIMFTDIRGFTTLSESMTPREIVAMLNSYFTPMTALVRAHQGTLDKFIGDALMAFWNAPVAVEGHPVLAVKTALGMQEKLKELNEHPELHHFGRALAMGVGVNTGKAYVGNMGSKELLNYTLIGDNVNLTSRLEGLCSAYGVGLVAGEETRRRCGEAFTFQKLDLLRVKGKKQPVEVFVPLPNGEGRERAEELSLYHQALDLYQKGDFAAALGLFSRLAEGFPAAKLYQIYVDRCRDLAAAPPEHWDGVWVMTSK